MPTYEYQCERCDGVRELLQPITAKAKRRLRCEKCGEVTPCRRLIGGGGAVLFKGSGFYETDYRSESYKRDARKDAEASKPKSENKKEKK